MKQKTLFTQPLIQCEVCGKNLLTTSYSGNFVLLVNKQKTEKGMNYYHIGYYCCKKNCDRILRAEVLKLPDVYIDVWEDISRFTEPVELLRIILKWMQRFRDGERMSEDAYRKLDDLISVGFFEVARDLTKEEEELLKFHLESGLFDFL
ncbi:MAG: hypothetical protein LUG98_16685 [Tannerellaceae bacterium]|nr:hypothetical protein [Tannerellaceae bacterium]